MKLAWLTDIHLNFLEEKVGETDFEDTGSFADQQAKISSFISKR